MPSTDGSSGFSGRGAFFSMSSSKLAALMQPAGGGEREGVRRANSGESWRL